MVRPGVEVHMKSAPPRRSAPTDTGTAFFAGITQRGRVDQAVLIRNMDEYQTYFGTRVSYGLLYDACDAAFQLGAAQIYVGRVVGPAATKDTRTFNDAGAAPSIAVDSIGPSVTGWSAQVVAGAVAGTAHVVVTDATGTILTQSPDYAAPTDFANWSNQDNFIRIRALGANVPAASAVVALAGGADDRANITDAVKAAAYPVLFPAGLGVGQLAYPGATTTQAQADLANFAQASGRVALLDMVDTPVLATLTAAGDAFRASAAKLALSETFVHMCADWHVIPGVTGGTTRTVPPSAIIAGLIAASDARSANPNVPAAAANGQSSITLRLSQVDRSDADRAALNLKGISTFRNVYGVYELYGYRTMFDPTIDASAAWDEFSAARTRMAISADLLACGEQFAITQIDGRRQQIAKFDGAARAVLSRYWALGALYGASASEAFALDTGPSVNTPQTIQNKELHAKVGIKTSPFAEWVVFDVVKVPVTGTV